MEGSPNEIRATLLLCDSVQSVGGKLYILGGGLQRIARVPGSAINISLAIRLTIPWSRANERIEVVARLRDQDGNPVEAGERPVVIRGHVEVGRPAGATPGMSFGVPLTMNVNNLRLPQAKYEWTLEAQGTPIASEPFEIRDAQPPGRPA